MSLDRNCKDIPYLLGRIAAIISASVELPTKLLTQAQEAPYIAFPNMSVWYHDCDNPVREEELREILGHFPSSNPFPKRLTLLQQGQYMIGYNHELADIYRERNRRKIAKAIRLKRIELDMTQQQLAERAGVTKQTIGNIESGDCNISLDILSAVMSVLGIKLSVE